ncbi:STAS domain-containing protein [Streptomyces sp. NPDC046831]|uniref:STAS domain-containing protein n=1 Tax=Streptomyces sp. NPDC046831 TaxID=3154805 RepID=UPI0033F4258F
MQVRKHERIFEISVRGDVDYAETDLLEAAWAEADEAGTSATVVDLSGVTFGDSGLLNALIAARQRHLASGRSLILLGPLQESIVRLLRLTGTFEHFTITDSRSAALEADAG